MLRTLTPRSRAAVLVRLALMLAATAPTANASPNRQCGVIKVRGAWLDVQTFGAAGPKCKTAKRIIRRTYKRRKHYRGYECSKGRFPQLWGCFHKNGSKNALAYYYDK